MAWSQTDLSFKALLNKRITSSTKQFYEEIGDDTLNTHIDNVWTQTIAYNDPATAVSAGVVQLYESLELYKDVSVSGDQCYYAFSAIMDDRLKDWVSDKYGSAYTIHLYQNDGTEIFPTDASQWLFSYQTGILIFQGIAPTSKPYKITGYRYIGTKGVGPVGLTGAQGITGFKGVTGIFGLTGFMGPTGLTGIFGLTGFMGPTGICGITGLNGLTGFMGPTGICGITGLDGLTGICGITGLDGLTGICGLTGFMGPTGIWGITGFMGPTGIWGITGLDGPTGLHGLTGFMGPTGIWGITGVSGLPTLTGLTTNYLPVATSSTSLGNSVVFNSGINVGINTPSPDQILDVGNYTGLDSYISINSALAYTSGFLIKCAGAINWVLARLPGTNDFAIHDYLSSSIKLIVKSITGRVGISTSSPGELLQVGIESSGATDRKAIKIGSGGYSEPAGYSLSSDGDKIIFYTADSFDARMGIGNSSDMWFKAMNGGINTGRFKWFIGGGGSLVQQVMAVDGVDGLTVTDAVVSTLASKVVMSDSSGKLINGTNTDVQIAAAVTASHAMQHAIDSTSNHSMGSLTDNHVVKRTNAVLGNSLIFDDGSSVGIGVSSGLVGALDVRAGLAEVHVESTIATNSTMLTIANGSSRTDLGCVASSGGTIASGSLPYSSVLGQGQNYPLHLATNGVVRMTLLGDGNAGIGTTAPSAPFEISSTDAGATPLKLVSTAASIGDFAGGIGMEFYSREGHTQAVHRAAIIGRGNDIDNVTGGNLLFKTVNSSNVLTERMRLNSAGSLGIGVSASLVGTLDVRSATAEVHIESTTATNPSYLSAKNGTSSAIIGCEGSVAGTLATGTSAYSTVINQINMYSLSFATNNTVRMSIFNDGGVGIGDVGTFNRGIINIRRDIGNDPLNGILLSVGNSDGGVNWTEETTHKVIKLVGRGSLMYQGFTPYFPIIPLYNGSFGNRKAWSGVLRVHFSVSSMGYDGYGARGGYALINLYPSYTGGAEVQEMVLSEYSGQVSLVQGTADCINIYCPTNPGPTNSSEIHIETKINSAGSGPAYIWYEFTGQVL